MASARPRATATVSTSSISEPEVEDDPFLVVFATSRYSRLAGLLVTARRGLGVGGRLGLGGSGRREGVLVQGLAGALGVGRGGRLGRRVVQQAALDHFLRTGVAAL